LRKLGIDAANVNGSTSRTEVLALLNTASRRVHLGSTPSDLVSVLALCSKSMKPETCRTEDYADEQPREVILTPFSLDPFPVSVEDFRAFVETTHYLTGAEKRGFAYATVDGKLKPTPGGNWRNAVTFERAQDRWPVVAVDFNDAQAYCHWKGRRLPTEDEWEYVARGPELHTFPWGNEPPTTPRQSQSLVLDVGPPEGIGGQYRGLSGIVWQWVDTPIGERRVLKGGSWLESNPVNDRPAARRYEEPDSADADSGFRCAITTTAWPDADYWSSLP
jgi:formylglycine-generating enzyme required for sulfatase activity